jgi:hypothetical protein
MDRAKTSHWYAPRAPGPEHPASRTDNHTEVLASRISGAPLPAYSIGYLANTLPTGSGVARHRTDRRTGALPRLIRAPAGAALVHDAVPLRTPGLGGLSALFCLRRGLLARAGRAHGPSLLIDQNPTSPPKKQHRDRARAMLKPSTQLGCDGNRCPRTRSLHLASASKRRALGNPASDRRALGADRQGRGAPTPLQTAGQSQRAPLVLATRHLALIAERRASRGTRASGYRHLPGQAGPRSPRQRARGSANAGPSREVQDRPVAYAESPHRSGTMAPGGDSAA